MTFNPTDFCTVETIGGVQHVTIDPHVVYPATIARIGECIQQEIFPSELIQQRVQGGVPVVIADRAKTLYNSAKSLPQEAWNDALLHRNTFDSPIGYAPPGQRNVSVFADNVRDSINRLWARGDALEVTMGWFLQSLRCKIGGSNNTILAGDRHFKL